MSTQTSQQQVLDNKFKIDDVKRDLKEQEPTYRLFAAARIPEDICEDVKKFFTMHRLSGMKWVKMEDLHITLHFYGGLTLQEKQRLIDELSQLKHKPIKSCQLYGLEKFNNRGFVNVLNITANPKPRIIELMDSINKDGFKSPHTTLARRVTNGRVSNKQVDQLIESCGEYKSRTFDIDEFELIQSELTPQGPIYTTILTVKLSDDVNTDADVDVDVKTAALTASKTQIITSKSFDKIIDIIADLTSDEIINGSSETSQVVAQVLNHHIKHDAA